jgi:hypothetical protein
MPRRIVQVRGAHGTDDDGAQLWSRESVPPDGVVMVAAPKTFAKTYAISGYVGNPEIEPVPYSWRGAAMVSQSEPMGAMRSNSMLVPRSTCNPASLIVDGTAVPTTVSTPSSTISWTSGLSGIGPPPR